MRTAIMRSMLQRLSVVPVAAFCFVLTAPGPADAQVHVGVSIAVGTPPPPLLVYEQPYVPGPGYIWTPGYWAWGPAGYFWVPGAWVLALEPGLLWTPGYWAYNDDQDVYRWHPGYWARHVGYYGGINYGFGYFGRGYVGGGWHRGHFRYNRAVTRVNPRFVHDVYDDRKVIGNPREGYHGRMHGGSAPSPVSPGWMRERRRPMTDMQRAHLGVSAEDRNQVAVVTHGHPRQLAVDHAFNSHNRPTTFERLRSQDRVAPSAHGMRTPPGHVGRADHAKKAKER